MVPLRAIWPMVALLVEVIAWNTWAGSPWWGWALMAAVARLRALGSVRPLGFVPPQCRISSMWNGYISLLFLFDLGERIY